MAKAIRYALRFDDAVHHYVDVEVVFPQEWIAERPQRPLDLSLAVWTPGSYMLREYARNLESVHARDQDDRPLRIEKTSKNRWRVLTSAQCQEVKVSYRVYCREMTVRTNWVERDFALLNGAPTFLTPVGHADVPCQVSIVLPTAWGRIVTSLKQLEPGGDFIADDYDDLVDSPILCGNPDLQFFVEDDKEHLLATVGGGHIFDGNRAATDAARIVQAHQKFWNCTPYARYVFLNLLTEGRGGLEHRNSSVLMSSPWVSRSRDDYVDWLGLVSHEFFHVWNIKRLRPEALGPFDYEAENYTQSLWIAEGLTAYYDDLQVHRAGLSTQAEYLARLSRNIEQVQKAPGRLVQSLAQASWDAWIKFYRRDENTDNSAVSYYAKGCVVGFLLDAKIRQHTQDKACLDTVMRQAYEKFSGKHGYREQAFRQLAQDVAGADLQDFFAQTVDSTHELDYQQALDWWGLTFEVPEMARAEHVPQKIGGYMGVQTRVVGHKLLVSQVLRDTPAYQCGLNVDDEIIAWDNFRVGPAQFAQRVEQTPPGSQVTLLVARRDRLLGLEVQVQKASRTSWRLYVRTKRSDAQQARLSRWLGTTQASSGVGG